MSRSPERIEKESHLGSTLLPDPAAQGSNAGILKKILEEEFAHICEVVQLRLKMLI